MPDRNTGFSIERFDDAPDVAPNVTVDADVILSSDANEMALTPADVNITAVRAAFNNSLPAFREAADAYVKSTNESFSLKGLFNFVFGGVSSVTISSSSSSSSSSFISSSSSSSSSSAFVPILIAIVIIAVVIVFIAAVAVFIFRRRSRKGMTPELEQRQPSVGLEAS